MTDIEPLARSAYANGTDPIDWACTLVEGQVEAWDTIRRARVHTPTAFPVYIVPLTTEAIARQIVGRLLDAGWTPPEVSR